MALASDCAKTQDLVPLQKCMRARIGVDPTVFRVEDA
jgi:hypothetical protein